MEFNLLPSGPTSLQTIDENPYSPPLTYDSWPNTPYPFQSTGRHDYQILADEDSGEASSHGCSTPNSLVSASSSEPEMFALSPPSPSAPKTELGAVIAKGEPSPLDILASVASDCQEEVAEKCANSPGKRKATTDNGPATKHRKISIHPSGLTVNTAADAMFVRGRPPPTPERCFHNIIAEKPTLYGNMYKVAWQNSWVHESRLPDIGLIRQHHFQQYGMNWEVLPMSPVMIR